MTVLVAVLCASCKGRGLSIVGVEPHVAYDCSGGEVGQYLFVFVRTEGCDEAKTLSLTCPEASLSWLDFSPVKGDEGLFYAVFSPAPSMPFPKSKYVLTLSDYYGGSAGVSFSLSYDENILPAGKNGNSGPESYAYFRKDGRLEIFGRIDKDKETLKANKNIAGKRLCRFSGDGGTVCLMPYQEIN